MSRNKVSPAFLPPSPSTSLSLLPGGGGVLAELPAMNFTFVRAIEERLLLASLH